MCPPWLGKVVLKTIRWWGCHITSLITTYNPEQLIFTDYSKLFNLNSFRLKNMFDHWAYRINRQILEIWQTNIIFNTDFHSLRSQDPKEWRNCDIYLKCFQQKQNSGGRLLVPKRENKNNINSFYIKGVSIFCSSYDAWLKFVYNTLKVVKQLCELIVFYFPLTLLSLLCSGQTIHSLLLSICSLFIHKPEIFSETRTKSFWSQEDISLKIFSSA